MDAAKIYQWSWTLESVVISTAGYKAWLKVLCRGIIHFPHLRLIKFSANDPIWGQSAIWETWMVFLIWESWIPRKKIIISCKVPNTSKHLVVELGRKNPISNSNDHFGENTAYLLVFAETSKSRLDMWTIQKSNQVAFWHFNRFSISNVQPVLILWRSLKCSVCLFFAAEQAATTCVVQMKKSKEENQGKVPCLLVATLLAGVYG